MLAVIAGLTLAWSGAATGGDKKGQPLSDAQFVLKASASDLAEINLGYIALKQSQNDEVKQFAQRMVKDHNQSSKELLLIAGKKSLNPAAQADAKHKAVADKLLTLKGADFDRTYMEQMVVDHQKAVALFKSQADQGKDEELKKFAAKTLPAIQMHLKMAQEISQKVGASKGTK